MGKKLAITDDGKHQISKKVFITGEDLLHHKVKKMFLTKNGVHCTVYSPGAEWIKYNCEESEETVGYIETDSAFGWSIGDTQTNRYYRLNYYNDYSFRTSLGFVGSGLNVATTIEELPSSGYIMDNEIVWSIISCAPIDDTGDAIAEVTLECVGLCTAQIETIYKQGATSYGTIEAVEGSLPEEGQLIEGSYAEGYCVMFVDDEYFYYVLK